MHGCRICQSPLEPFVDFGRMPLANAFLTREQFADEYFYHLRAAWCRRCGLVQLVEQPPAERMFNGRYPFFTRTSARMSAHFAALAADLIAGLPDNARFVVEIGSNDGTLLRHVADAGISHAGIEPSASVARAATALGVSTWPRFFDAGLVSELIAAHGQAGAIVAANALSHVWDLHGVIGGIKTLLAPDGTCVIEDPYWGDVVAQTAFDQIYDEHASYFSLTSLAYLFRMHDLEIHDVAAFDVHGGSRRYFISHAGRRTATRAVSGLREREQASGLFTPAAFEAFRQRIDNTGETLLRLLRGHQARRLRVAGYGATSKSTTAINYFGITPELVEFISDTTPEKQGTFTPGAHIPVRPHEAFAGRYPDRAVLFSWNHATEILAREQAFTASGGRWILYVPQVHER